MGKVSLEEVKVVLFQMQLNKAPDSDGYNALFYKLCWDFMGVDILGIVEESRKKKTMLKDLNNTNIALIPKKEHFESFADF